MDGAERAALVEKSLLGKPVPAMTSADMEALRTPALDKVVAKAKETEKAQKRKLELQEDVPNKKSKAWTPRWSTQRVRTVPEELPGGCALVRISEDVLRCQDILSNVGFKVEAFAVASLSYKNFLEAAVSLSTRRQCGHLVVVENLARDSWSVAALACRLIGGFLCERAAVLALPKAGPAGIQFSSSYKARPRHVAISKALAAEVPDLAHLLAAVAGLPGSKLRFASDLHVLQKEYGDYKEKRGAGSKPWLSLRIGATDAELNVLTSKRKKYPHLYCSRSDFLAFLSTGVVGEAVCPGRWWRA